VIYQVTAVNLSAIGIVSRTVVPEKGAQAVEISRVKCDVLVVGGGAAGIRAAIEACDCGADVMLVSKRNVCTCGSTFYELSLPWGINASGSESKSDEVFLKEIVKASCGSLNTALTEILVKDSNARFSDLCEYGMRFAFGHDTGEKPCFGEKPRGGQLLDLDNARECFAGQIRKRGVRVVDNVSIVDLLVRDGSCFGAVGMDNENNQIAIYAKAVVLATGGAEHLWKYNLVTPDVSGDGYAMAFRHGARLTNMEYIQFIPGTIAPLRKINFFHPTLESMPEILNGNGEPILGRYLPNGVSADKCLKERASHGPFSYEDDSKYFEIAMCKEESSEDIIGTRIRYSAFYHAQHKFKIWDDFLLSLGIDTRKQDLSIYPHCHAFNGGIVIDEHCATDIDALYACGECAGGPHGANRMGGNAILATQVFGKIAGESAARRSRTARHPDWPVEDCVSELKRSSDTGRTSRISPKAVIENIASLMQRSAGIIRNEVNLQRGLDLVEQMRRDYNLNYYLGGDDIRNAVSAGNHLTTAWAVLSSMLNRRESRGSHYREDFPARSDEYGDMIILKSTNGTDVTMERKRLL
jgi:succinate dehydrogenase/fumarate reductase flavoprotein subunit